MEWDDWWGAIVDVFSNLKSILPEIPTKFITTARLMSLGHFGDG